MKPRNNNIPPEDPQPAISRRKSETELNIPEPELTSMLQKYCDMRRRVFAQDATRADAKQPRRYLKLLSLVQKSLKRQDDCVCSFASDGRRAESELRERQTTWRCFFQSIVRPNRQVPHYVTPVNQPRFLSIGKSVQSGPDGTQIVVPLRFDLERALNGVVAYVGVRIPQCPPL